MDRQIEQHQENTNTQNEYKTIYKDFRTHVLTEDRNCRHPHPKTATVSQMFSGTLRYHNSKLIEDIHNGICAGGTNFEILSRTGTLFK